MRESWRSRFLLHGHKFAHSGNERVYGSDKFWNCEVFAARSKKLSAFSDGSDLQFGKILCDPLPDAKLCELVERGFRNFLREPCIPGWVGTKDRGKIAWKVPCQKPGNTEFVSVESSRRLKPDCRTVCFEANETGRRTRVELANISAHAKARRAQSLLRPCEELSEPAGFTKRPHL